VKVGFNARYLYDSALRGLNRYTFCLLRALEQIPEVQIHLVSEDRYPVHDLYRAALRAKVHNLVATRTVFWEQWLLPRYLRNLKPDVFHAPADGGLPFRRECPYILTLHGVPDCSLASMVSSGVLNGTLTDYLDTIPNVGRLGWRFQGLRARLFRRLYLRAADLVITVSEFSKDELVRFLGVLPEKVRVIPEAAGIQFTQPLGGPFIEDLCNRLRIPPRFVLFVGGFDKRKNVSTLLTAFALLKKVEPDVALVLVGLGGDIQVCKLQASGLGMQEGRDVFFLQGLPDLELAALYRAASVFTTLSWHEGFCLPLVEAMTCGTPIVASSFGAVPEILGGAGWLVDPRRPEETVEAVRTILGRSNVRDALRTGSFERSKCFSWQKAAEETVRAYREVLG
jgi:glycosyltransferase involved in cell wall biosynthesis